MQKLSHNANQEDQQLETVESNKYYQEKADNRPNANTPKNNHVDVFEFEPSGFMSNGRW